METKDKISMVWPEMGKPDVALHQNVIFVYGRPKIGKSTLMAGFPNTLIINTELSDGLKHIDCRSVHVTSWLQFLDVLLSLEETKGKTPMQTVGIDTADGLYAHCCAFVANKMGVADVADIDYGKGFSAAGREFTKQVKRLFELGVGVIFSSHYEEKEVDADSLISPYAATQADKQGKMSIIVPTLQKRARQLILGLSDIIGFADVDKDMRRVIHFSPTRFFEAGDRSGRLPNTCPLTYEAIVNSYYGDSGKAELVARIERAREYLKENGIEDGDVVDTKTATVPQLESHLQHLRIVAKRKKAVA